jgi:hypothetical protein
MNKFRHEFNYTRDCVCTGTNPECSYCKGRNVVPIGNISFAEMQVGVMYAVKIFDSAIGECMLKKWDDIHL